jgi:anti-sigma B factor antagonist
MRLNIQERQDGDVTVLELEGALILGPEADALRERVRQLLKARKVKIVLHLQNLNRLDSVGVGTMMDAVRRTRKAGGDLRLAQLSKTAADVLGLMTLTRRPDLLAIFPDEQEAIASLRPPP